MPPPALSPVASATSHDLQQERSCSNLIQLNALSGPTYLDNFPRDEQGGVRIGERGPRCPYLDADGRCGIHERRRLASLIDRLRGLIHRIASDLAADLLDIMRRVAGVSQVPDYDCYIVLGPLGSAYPDGAEQRCVPVRPLP